MISRTNRFHGRASLRRMQTRSKSVRSTMLALKYAAGEQQNYRLAVVVSRKVSKSAVVRNRIRRRLYECVRILSGAFVTPFDLVLVVYDEKIAALPSAELTTEVAKLFHKAKLTPARAPDRAIVNKTEAHT